MILSVVLAAAEIGWETPITAGGIVLLALAGWVWFRPSVDQLRADKAAVEAQRDELLAVYHTVVLPALIEQNAQSARAVAVLERLEPHLARFVQGD